MRPYQVMVLAFYDIIKQATAQYLFGKKLPLFFLGYLNETARGLFVFFFANKAYIDCKKRHQ